MHRAVRFPPSVWRSLQHLAFEEAESTSASELVRRALTSALAGDLAEVVEFSRLHRGITGPLVTIEMPLELHRDLRQAVIEHGSTGMAIVLAAVYAAYPGLLP
jgi:hypothetical protein